MKRRIDLLKSGSDYLAREGVANPQGEAEIFLSWILNCPRIKLYLDNLTVEKKELRHYWELLIERVSGLPLQYLIGSTEFMGLEFKVSPGVFIPRPETEILVETVLDLPPSTFDLPPSTFHLPPAILDIGTGCGNIAVSIGKYLEKAYIFACDIFACDISDTALQLTKENLRLNKAGVYLTKSDLFSAFKKGERFSIIVSNPPYIEAREISALPRELHYEPREAYDGGADGLFYYRRIIYEAPAYLRDRGVLALEIGDNQADAVKEIFLRNGRFSIFKVVKDYNAIERVIVAQLSGVENRE